jgi:L-ascorbate metabolism protein UlaG (beta-lactamase superfamily)
MKVTKFPQSTLVIEDGGKRILIDPGTIATGAHNLDEFGEIGAVLFTHQHADHLDEDAAKDYHDKGTAIFGNQDVVDKLGFGTAVTDGQQFEAGGLPVSAHDLPHCKMSDGSDGPPNTGYVVSGHFFHPGDGTQISGLSVEATGAPIAGPSIGLEDAKALVHSVGAKTVLPIHYDYFKNDPDEFATMFGEGITVVVLAPGESADI